MVKAAALENTRLNPLGYKILLEVIAKAHYEKLVEVPYIFQERERGASKLGPRQYLECLQHLVRLAVVTGQFRGWLRYGLVALLGAGIDIGLFATLVEKAAWPPVAALLAAVQVALLSNFAGSEVFTFRSAETPAFRPGVWGRLARYERICLAGIVLNFLVTLLIIAQGGRAVYAAGAGVVAGGAVNLLMNIPAIWRLGAIPLRKVE